MIPEKVWRHAKIHAVGEYPNEACGLFIRVDTATVYFGCRNISSSPGEEFIIDPEDLKAAEESGEILAVFHSHPDGPARLSPADEARMEYMELPWAVVAVERGTDGHPSVTGTAWQTPAGVVYPLVGRPFIHGVLDCYTIIRDYYARVLGIKIPDFIREDKWWDRGDNLYMKHYEDAGFTKIPLSELREHDVILMQIRSSEPNHGGVYIGNDTILHHMYNRLSTREIYGGYYADHFICALRHKDVRENHPCKAIQ